MPRLRGESSQPPPRFSAALLSSPEVTQKLVDHFADLVVRERRAGKFLPWYLNFFNVIIQIGSEPVPQNQTMVLKAIQKFGANKMLRLGKEMGAEKIMNLLRSFKSASLLTDIVPDQFMSRQLQDDPELIYYISCVELLLTSI